MTHPLLHLRSAAIAALLLTNFTTHAEDTAPSGTVVEPVLVRAVARFDFDKAAMDPEDQARILADLGRMTDVTWQSVAATGHTDNVGPDPYNRALSARRAQAVKAFLVSKGVDPQMISVNAKAAT
ncbi:MAG: OmpA family protein, partial [Burkholderiales bacterium]|nr:OmpA family protein [Burkholderiales bacterium]